MRGFTYHDYLYYKRFFINNSIKRDYILKENGELYNYEEKEPHQPHDKIFKEILDNYREKNG